VHQRLLGQKRKCRCLRFIAPCACFSAMELFCRELGTNCRRGVALSCSVCTPRDQHHLVCIGCGRTEEFESAPVLTAGEAPAPAPRDFA